mgnify:CR=1 FL=1
MHNLQVINYTNGAESQLAPLSAYVNYVIQCVKINPVSCMHKSARYSIISRDKLRVASKGVQLPGVCEFEELLFTLFFFFQVANLRFQFLTAFCRYGHA